MRQTVLLLGTGHWANPNRDYVNDQYDDMLAPQRQREIRDCAERLKRFAPTKVAVEVAAERAEALNEEYRRYRAGDFTLTANEVHQLGFRIAAELGHERIYAIDWNGGTGDLGEVFDFARVHQPELYAEFATEDRRPTVGDGSACELLSRMNDPAALRRSHRLYLVLARVGAAERYVGVDWVKGWYERNLKIFVNLTRIASAPEDRVLVIYGAGHVPLLAQFMRDSDLYTLEPTAAYLG
jgi:hypothetical protein